MNTIQIHLSKVSKDTACPVTSILNIWIATQVNDYKLKKDTVDGYTTIGLDTASTKLGYKHFQYISSDENCVAECWMWDCFIKFLFVLALCER